MSIIQVVVFGLVAVLLAIQFKSKNQEFGVYISLTTAIIFIFIAFDKMELIIDTIDKLSGQLSINKIYIQVLLKIVGIAYIAEFGSQICKDAGYTAIASQIEIIGKLSILIVSLPILLSVIELIIGIIK